MIEDKKRQAPRQPVQSVVASRRKIGLSFLGNHYMDAYTQYYERAESCVNLAKSYKPALAAARACYMIAAENAIAIQALFQDDQHPIKLDLKQKIQNIFFYIETIDQKMKENWEFDPRKVFKSQYTEREQLIIEHAGSVRGKSVDLFNQNTGIIK